MGLLWSSLLSWWSPTRQYKMCVVGLDNAGKTTALYQMHLGSVIATAPTIGSNVEEVSHGGVLIQCWDLGGQETLRQSWRTYFTATDAITFVIDTTDRDRVPIARRELHTILSHVELKDAALLVLANKSDVTVSACARRRHRRRARAEGATRRVAKTTRLSPFFRSRPARYAGLHVRGRGLGGACAGESQHPRMAH